MAVSKSDTYKLAYDVASKGLASQVITVDNARARIGVLLGGGNVATAFLGKDAIAAGLGDSPNPLFWAGAAAFVVFALACIWALVPTGGWTFNLSAARVIEAVDRDEPMDIEDIYKSLATWQEKYFDENAVQLGRLFRLIQIAAVAIVIELAAFVAVVGGLKP